ncbi:Synaptotagmin-like protein 2 [Liparis tanakae]|uniref:Synaptotagmin-like protein 2 n=1 Tax=Liparis tanakae TaxID=230148 RepID=A0A4Z2IQN8_9TELE|nr:Synaptotagmin-like protein 2 [Liparis tanakae]
MIDLSFLTEEEQETIRTVLKRDAKLKKAEELRKTGSDERRLKYMTGEWFYETKQLRHQDRIHGSEIIRASMRHSHKPLTILELSQILPEKPSFVSSENKEVFVPPALSGILQQPSDERNEKQKSHVLEHFHPEFLSLPMSGLISDDQESGKPVQLETESEEDCHSQTTSTGWPTGHTIRHQKLPEERTEVSFEAPSNTKPFNGGSEGSSDTVLPKPQQRLLGIFERENEKTTEVQSPVQSPQKEEVKIPKQKEQDNTHNLHQGAADRTTDKPASVKQEAKPSEMTEVRTLQLTSQQNTPFEEKLTLVDKDTQQWATEERVVQLPERLSDLKAFWEKENSGPKIIFTKDENRRKDISKSGVEAPHSYQSDSDAVRINSNLSTQTEITVEDTDERSPLTDCSFFVNVSQEDGTYRANPVLIYEETDDSLTGSVTESQLYEPQSNVIIPVPSCEAFNSQQREKDIPGSLPRQSSSSHQRDWPAKIRKAKHFWEKEYIGPRVIASRVKEASRSSILSNKEGSPQFYLRTSLHNREMSEEEAHVSLYKSKSNVVFKPSKVTDTSCVSSGSTDIESACHQYQVKADNEYQERPLSPRQSQTPRSKDQDDEVRRSPSKTCHPRVLPRESSSPKRSKLEGSPFKTFPIEIDPQAKVVEEQQGKPTPVPRQKKSPANEVKETVLTETKPSMSPILSHPEDTGANLGNVTTQQSSSSSSTLPQYKKASKKKLITFPRLARSFIPEDYQHYLGPKEKSHVPLFNQVRAVVADNYTLHTPQNAPRDFVGNQSDSPTEVNPGSINSWIVQNKDGSSSQNTTTKAWSLSRASSGNSTLSSSKQMKSSVSMTVLEQDEDDSDSTFETNLGWRRNTGSSTSNSTSNLSLSSGLASISSVSGSISSLYPADFGDIEVQGSIQLAVNYIQNLGEFHIFVVHCRDLAVADTKKNCSDPTKSYSVSLTSEGQQRTNESRPEIPATDIPHTVLPDTSRKSRQKTRVVKRTANPMFNHTMVYDGFRSEDLREACVEITVWDHDRLSSHYIGGLRLGLGTGKSYGVEVLWMDSTTDEAHLWQRMLQNAPSSRITDVDRLLRQDPLGPSGALDGVNPGQPSDLTAPRPGHRTISSPGLGGRRGSVPPVWVWTCTVTRMSVRGPLDQRWIHHDKARLWSASCTARGGPRQE